MPDINRIKSKRFHYLDVMEAFHISEYADLKNILDGWVAEKRIVPVKKSGKTSFVPSIYIEYKKVNEKADYTEYEKEIRKLHPDLEIARYLKNPRQFVDNEKEIIRLSEYLWNNREALSYAMSVKERSYDIWRDEKFLESTAGRQICAVNHLDHEALNYFYTPESFFFYDLHTDMYRDVHADIHKDVHTDTYKDVHAGMYSDMHDNSPMVTALVIENKDTWYSLGKALKQSEKKTLCNVKIDYMIYGEGNKATKLDAVCMFMEDITGQPYRILYAGDIDIAGIDMLYRCIKGNREESIKPFAALYKQMLMKVSLDDLKPTDDNRGLHYETSFFEYFTEEERELIKQVLDSNKRIPQEILNYSDYLKIVR